VFETGEPATGPELVAALRRLTSEGAKTLGTMPIELFFAPQGNRWSPAEHARHLQKSSAPLIAALRLPAWLLRLRFGASHGPSRTSVALRADYQAALAAGGTAGRFAPRPESSPMDPALRRGEILTHWFITNERVGQLLARWREDQLDAVLLPHPLLGNLTVREMAAFTVSHTAHHLTLVTQRLAGGA
jgi:DinB superfamily